MSFDSDRTIGTWRFYSIDRSVPQFDPSNLMSNAKIILGYAVSGESMPAGDLLEKLRHMRQILAEKLGITTESIICIWTPGERSDTMT